MIQWENQVHTSVPCSFSVTLKWRVCQIFAYQNLLMFPFQEDSPTLSLFFPTFHHQFPQGLVGGKSLLWEYGRNKTCQKNVKHAEPCHLHTSHRLCNAIFMPPDKEIKVSPRSESSPQANLHEEGGGGKGGISMIGYRGKFLFHRWCLHHGQLHRIRCREGTCPGESHTKFKAESALNLEFWNGDFPSSPVAKILSSQFGDLGFHPWSEN